MAKAHLLFTEVKGYKNYDFAVKHVEKLIEHLEDDAHIQYVICATAEGRYSPMVFCQGIYMHYFINKNCCVKVVN